MHHHFDSVAAAVRSGVDIIPQVTTVKEWGRIRKVADTEAGREIFARCALIEQLAHAYRLNKVRQETSNHST